MTLDEKRDAIEILLCCAQEPWSFQPRATTWTASRTLGHPASGAYSAGQLIAARRWKSVRPGLDWHKYTHGDTCLEAAYRLIESSAVLRREWFGR